MRDLRPIRFASLVVVAIACSRDRSLENEHLYAVQLRTEAVGCYRLDLAPGVDSEWRRGVSPVFVTTFRLHPELNTRVPFGFRAISGWPHVPSDTMRHIDGGWGADSLTDSIRVSMGDGYEGVSLTLSPANGDWRGVARYYSDADPPRVHHELGQVRARRITCADTALIAPAG